MRLNEALRGRTILVTGVTGFVGHALLARLVRDLPDVRVVALVRPRGSQPARDRVAALLRQPSFGGADPEGLLADRVRVLEGDLASPPPLPDDVDVVVHCAGEVSFDPPIHEAFAVNVAGVQALLERVREAGTGRRSPLYVHVSTAYVSGSRRGIVPEAPVEHDADWRTEMAAAERIAGRAEDASRTPQVLRRLMRAAEREHGRAGPISTATDAEARRRAWVVDQQKAAGAERARSLGWTDVYTFTKAMGERVVEEYAERHGVPVRVVRPSIIESSLAFPRPGWIEGFKMAEPIIMAFGRGELPEFPAAPDSVVDIVPVDHVVDALIAVAADGLATAYDEESRPRQPAYFHVSSGHRNPLTFRRLYELVREYFDKHPFDLGERGAVRLPTWHFPGAEAVESVLARGERAHRLADRALGLAPRGERVRRLARDLDRQRRRLEFLRRYMDLYRAYTQAELGFLDDNTVALHRALDPQDAAAGFGFDTAVVDWTTYIRDIHCPSVTEPLRKYDVVRRRRNATEVRQRPLETARRDDGPVLAVFDMDGTLISSNVVETFLWLRLPELSRPQQVREVARLVRRLPHWVSAERRDRGTFLRSVYRRYAGADLDELDRLVDSVLTPHVLERVSGAALRRVREHRAAGHRTVLITGAIRPLTRPIAPLFDVVVAADLATTPHGDGSHRASGFLTSPPLVGEGRAAWLRSHAAAEGVDLRRCHAYADSHSDLPLLQAVGLPTAVSPDVALYRVARASRWPIEDWATARGGNRLKLPDLRSDPTGAGLPS